MASYIAPTPVMARKVVDPLQPTMIPINPVQTAQKVVDPLQATNISIPQTTPIAPTVARTVTVDPLQQSANIPISSPQTQTVQTPPAQTPSLFNSIPQIGSAYNQVLQDSLTGKIYDPFAAGSKEALARAEANKRASVASQISSSGLSGQGLGRQIASGAEGDILKNRFDVLNGIEQARVGSQQNALGEARAYGQIQEDIRRYGNSEAWKAYEAALANGSDADVIARYKEVTGKDLDPMSVATYRGYAREAAQQGLTAGNIANRQAMQNLTQAQNSQAGADFASYAQTHLDLGSMTAEQAMSDQGFANTAQKLWEANGGSGKVPPAWALMQYKAANDPRLTNQIVAGNYAIDQAIASRAMSEEDGKLLKDFNSSGMVQFLKRDPATGKVTLDYDALQKLTGTTSTSSTTSAETSTVPSEVALGKTYIQNGKIYRKTSNTASEEVTYDPDDPFSEDNKMILEAGEKDNPYYSTVLNAQYNAFTNGHDITKVNTAQAGGTTGRLEAFRREFEKYKNLSFDSPIIQKFKADLETASKTKNPGDGKYYNLTVVKDGNSWQIVRK